MSNTSNSHVKEITSEAEEQLEASEYDCKYCQNKFSNKQALGGHQNAHKIERSIEKGVHDIHKNQLGYFAGQSSHPMIGSPYSPGSFYRSQELINRSLANNPYQAHYVPYTHPRFNPPAQPAWNANRVPQFAPPTPNMHFAQPFNAHFPTIGNGGSNVRPTTPFVGGARVLLNENVGGQTNGGTNLPENQQPEDSDLDLTLRL